MSLRTKESEQAYAEYRANLGANPPCALCSREPLKSFKYWKITDNKFPYNLIAKTHHMIMPITHSTEAEIPVEAWHEYNEIKHTYLFTEYEYLIEATLKKKSIPGHFHVHLIVSNE